MIYIIITSYGEVTAVEHAVRAILEQGIKQSYKVLVVDPFDETRWMIEDKFAEDKHVSYVTDDDKGKSYALNAVLKNIYSKNKDDIIIMTDGDVYVGKNAIKNIIEKFEDLDIGCVCGKPTTLNKRSTIFGYWSHASFDEMNNTRKELASKKEFFEVSGYLFAIRNSIISSFQVGASEDNIIPLMFWEKGYKIGYAENAEVYVLNPQNLREWVAQKKRNIKGHIALKGMRLKVPDRKNTMLAEAVRGFKALFSHPKNAREFVWFIAMAFSRLYAWLLAYHEVYIQKKQYKDGWRGEIELQTTKPSD